MRVIENLILVSIHALLILLFVIQDISTVSIARANDENEKLSKFIDWFQSNGGILDGVEIKDFEGMGKGLGATVNIESNSRVLKVPSDLILSKASLEALLEKNTKSEDKYVYREMYESFEGESLVIAWLLLESKKGASSFYAPYIDVLPTYIPSLLHFTKNSLQELQNTDLALSAKGNINTVELDYMEFINVAGEFWPYNIKEVSLDDYKWAMTVTNSRALRFSGEIYLSPMADLFNYSPAPGAEKRQPGQGASFLDHHKLSTDGSLTVLADRNAKKGSQLFEDYGDNNDDLYLTYHGFVSIDNPFRCLDLKPARDPNIMPTREHDEFLRSLPFTGEPSACVRKDGSFNSYFAYFMLISSSSSSTLMHCLQSMQKKNMNPKSPKIWKFLSKTCGYDAAGLMSGTLTESSELAMKHIYRLIDSSFLKSAPMGLTSIIEDEALLTFYANQLTSLSPKQIEFKLYNHRTMATSYRLERKRLLLQICEIYQHNNCIEYLNRDFKEVSSSPAGISAEEIEEYENQNNIVFFSSGASTDEETQSKLKAFNDWFEASGASPSFLKAELLPVYRIGTKVTQSVKLGDTYLGSYYYLHHFSSYFLTNTIILY